MSCKTSRIFFQTEKPSVRLQEVSLTLLRLWNFMTSCYPSSLHEETGNFSYNASQARATFLQRL